MIGRATRESRFLKEKNHSANRAYWRAPNDANQRGGTRQSSNVRLLRKANTEQKTATGKGKRHALFDPSRMSRANRPRHATNVLAPQPSLFLTRYSKLRSCGFLRRKKRRKILRKIKGFEECGQFLHALDVSGVDGEADTGLTG